MSQQCLPVAKRKKSNDNAKVSFDDVHEMDAAEYLSRVVHQASQLPDIFVSRSKTTFRSNRRSEVPIEGSAASLSYLVSDRTTLQRAPSLSHLPKNNELWIDQTLSAFSRLRDYLNCCQEQGIGGKDTNRLLVPALKDGPGWHIFCVGTDDARGNEGAYFDDGSDTRKDEAEDPWEKNLPSKGYTPTVSLLLQMDQVMTRRILSHLAHYVNQGWTVSEQRALWIYSLLARLDRPIHRDDAAMLYQLLKSLCRMRAELTDASRSKSYLVRLNVLITIIGVYLEQGGGVAGVMSIN